MCRGANDRYKLGGLTRPAVSWRSPTPLQHPVASDLQVQIERLYQAVRARLSDRVALLEAADPEIRAHVERMLSVDDSATFFDASAVAAPRPDARSHTAAGSGTGVTSVIDWMLYASY